MKGKRELSIYDGRECLGRIVVAANGKARAFDRQGKLLGAFANYEAASAAITAAAAVSLKRAPRVGRRFVAAALGGLAG
jgi:hypothetical protein